MIGAQGWQRVVLGALVVTAAAATALGFGHGASAEAPRHVPVNYHSKEEMQLECEAFGGVFIDDSANGNLWCIFANGDEHLCDASGNDCILIPRGFLPTAPGVVGEPGNTLDPGSTTPAAPVATDAPATAGQSSLAAASGGHDRDHHIGKNGQHRKKGRHGGKHHKRETSDAVSG